MCSAKSRLPYYYFCSCFSPCLIKWLKTQNGQQELRKGNRMPQKFTRVLIHSLKRPSDFPLTVFTSIFSRASRTMKNPFIYQQLLLMEHNLVSITQAEAVVGTITWKLKCMSAREAMSLTKVKFKEGEFCETVWFNFTFLSRWAFLMSAGKALFHLWIWVNCSPQNTDRCSHTGS